MILLCFWFSVSIFLFFWYFFPLIVILHPWNDRSSIGLSYNVELIVLVIIRIHLPNVLGNTCEYVPMLVLEINIFPGEFGSLSEFPVCNVEIVLVLRIKGCWLTSLGLLWSTDMFYLYKKCIHHNLMTCSTTVNYRWMLKS